MIRADKNILRKCQLPVVNSNKIGVIGIYVKNGNGIIGLCLQARHIQEIEPIIYALGADHNPSDTDVGVF